jgi:hypothetical protein
MKDSGTPDGSKKRLTVTAGERRIIAHALRTLAAAERPDEDRRAYLRTGYGTLEGDVRWRREVERHEMRLALAERFER